MSREAERAHEGDLGPVTYSWSAPPFEPSQARRWWNLGLAAAVTSLLGIWFAVHFEPWLDKVLIVFGSLSAFAVWKVVQGALDKQLGDASRQALGRFLQRPWATDVLVASLLVALVLLTTTSSVYLSREGVPPGQSRFRVRIDEEGDAVPPEELEVTASQPLAGHPFLLRTRFGSLNVVVVEPRGYRPLLLPFRPWSAIRLHGFERDTFPLLRLIPGEGLIGELPEPGGERPATTFSLLVMRGADRIPVQDVRNQGLYLGANEPDLELAVAGLDQSALRGELKAYLVKIDVPESTHDESLVRWETYRRAGTPRFAEGDDVRVLIRQQGAREALCDCRFTVKGGLPVQTVFLRKEPQCESR